MQVTVNIQTIERVVNLLSPEANVLTNMSQADAEARVLSGSADAVREIDGQFAILAKANPLGQLGNLW